MGSITSKRKLPQDDYDRIIQEKSEAKKIFYLSPHCKSTTFVLLLLAIVRGDPSSDDWERLIAHATIQSGNEDAFKQLLARNVYVFSKYDQRTLLERAIILNNLDILCAILYYGGYHHYVFNGQSAFLYSMQCRCSEDIQKTLIEYEEDLNEHFGNWPLLYWAVSYESPIILDIIERGGDINYFAEETNVITYSFRINCNAEIFKLLWDRFDYSIWKKSYSKCVLLVFLLESTEKNDEWRKSILEVLFENEEKLRLDIEHHNNSYFYNSDSLISDVFLVCSELNLPLATIHSYLIHLLSHGAFIFKSDLDKLYYNSPEDPTDFINMLLFMDLKESENLEGPQSPMYFKYTLQPDLYEFLSNCRLNFGDCIDMNFMETLKFIFHYNEDVRKLVQDFDTSDINKNKILEDSTDFPSLLELSRDSLRTALCNKYSIKDVGSFYSSLRNTDFPNFIKELLTFQRYVHNIYKS